MYIYIYKVAGRAVDTIRNLDYYIQGGGEGGGYT